MAAWTLGVVAGLLVMSLIDAYAEGSLMVALVWGVLLGALLAFTPQLVDLVQCR